MSEPRVSNAFRRLENLKDQRRKVRASAINDRRGFTVLKADWKVIEHKGSSRIVEGIAYNAAIRGERTRVTCSDDVWNSTDDDIFYSDEAIRWTVGELKAMNLEGIPLRVQHASQKDLPAAGTVLHNYMDDAGNLRIIAEIPNNTKFGMAAINLMDKGICEQFSVGYPLERNPVTKEVKLRPIDEISMVNIAHFRGCGARVKAHKGQQETHSLPYSVYRIVHEVDPTQQQQQHEDGEEEEELEDFYYHLDDDDDNDSEDKEKTQDVKNLPSSTNVATSTMTEEQKKNENERFRKITEFLESEILDFGKMTNNNNNIERKTNTQNQSLGSLGFGGHALSSKKTMSTSAAPANNMNNSGGNQQQQQQQLPPQQQQQQQQQLPFPEFNGTAGIPADLVRHIASLKKKLTESQTQLQAVQGENQVLKDKNNKAKKEWEEKHLPQAEEITNFLKEIVKTEANVELSPEWEQMNKDIYMNNDGLSQEMQTAQVCLSRGYRTVSEENKRLKAQNEELLRLTNVGRAMANVEDVNGELDNERADKREAKLSRRTQQQGGGGDLMQPDPNAAGNQYPDWVKNLLDPQSTILGGKGYVLPVNRDVRAQRKPAPVPPVKTEMQTRNATLSRGQPQSQQQQQQPQYQAPPQQQQQQQPYMEEQYYSDAEYQQPEFPNYYGMPNRSQSMSQDPRQMRQFAFLHKVTQDTDPTRNAGFHLAGYDFGDAGQFNY